MYYFDHSATTPIHPDVLDLMHEIGKKTYGNPSSVHKKGRKARSIIEKSRRQIADAIGSEPNKIIFTSGGTESNNQVLWSRLGQKRNHIISNLIEHPAIINVLKFLKNYNINYSLCPVDSKGEISLNNLKKEIKVNTGLISVMLANNEIGTIQPIKKIMNIAIKNNILVHSDAVHCLGKMKLNVTKMGIDFLSLSAHKFYGPKGIGILYIKDKNTISPYLIGGGQESGLRGGTENTASIAGMGLAAKIAVENINQNIKKLNFYESKFISGLKLIYPKAIINGNKQNKLPGLVSASFPGFKSNLLMTKLDRQGIYVANGAACGSGDVKPSTVLNAISLKPEINISTLRFSFGSVNSENQIKYLLQTLNTILN
tara:strand:- start:848 stop:1960 length:1113 start_codon:yes stop_codon:yes gene_type:complete